MYQRKGSDWNKNFGYGEFRRKDRRLFQQQIPNVQSGWFTRPYPYHLDFYRMNYGGSYAPYFGSLHGPPAAVTAPPYFGPYYGGWAPEAGGYAPDGFNGYGSMPVGPPGLPPEGAIVEGPVETVVPGDQPVDQRNNESLPTPGQ